MGLSCYDDANKRVTVAKTNIQRMSQAVKFDDERQKQSKCLAGAYGRLEQCPNNPVDCDNARRGMLASLERSMHIERNALGEHLYGHAKLQLKLAKAKCESGDIEGGLHDTGSAAKTIRWYLGVVMQLSVLQVCSLRRY